MTATTNAAGLAFDTLAQEYDATFTASRIGRAQRDAVWAKTLNVFVGRRTILELNCGTGEDAIFLARHGHRVTAIDASREMIALARQRAGAEVTAGMITLHALPIEDLEILRETTFDAVFSNFSGLNCVLDLRVVAKALAQRTCAGAPMLLCLSTRYCLWETVWYSLCGRWTKAFRRWSGRSLASLNGLPVDVFYPTLREVRRTFSPWFRVESTTGIGVIVPPSYLEGRLRGRPRMLAFMRFVDSLIATLPGFCCIGDHMLIHLVREAGQP